MNYAVIVCNDRAPPNIRLGELSMGMSGDYEIAIQEGATLVYAWDRHCSKESHPRLWNVATYPNQPRRLYYS